MELHLYSGGLYGAVVIALWGLITVLTLGWILLGTADAEPVPAGDPYAAEVAEFRQQIHDWDRA